MEAGRIESDPRLPGLRVLLAPNPGPFTGTGTRVHIVGARDPAIIDPGPDHEGHLDLLADEVADADRVQVLLTHNHPDHADGVDGLMRRLGERGVIAETAVTDAGDLLPVPTPGHSLDHVVFRWSEADAVFVGDHVLGLGDTTWVGAYRECVADYLESLDVLEEMGARYLVPAHGPVIDDPEGLVARYRHHRMDRIAQVREARGEHPDASGQELADAIYGPLPAALTRAAVQGVDAMLVWLEEE